MIKHDFKIGDLVEFWLGNTKLTVTGFVKEQFYDEKTNRKCFAGDILCTFEKNGKVFEYNYPPAAINKIYTF